MNPARTVVWAGQAPSPRGHPAPNGATPAARFGRVLRRHRLAADLTMGQLAELAGVERSTVSRLESGDRDPGRELVGFLAGALNLDPADADEMLLSAGFAPLRPATDRRLAGEPEICSLLAALQNDRLPPALARAVRDQAAGLAALARAAITAE